MGKAGECSNSSIILKDKGFPCYKFMNVLEYIKFDIIENKVLKHGIIEIAKMYKEGFECLLFAIASTILIIFFPITLTVKAVYKIKEVKK